MNRKQTTMEQTLFLQTDKLKIAYNKRGDGEPFILLHGNGEDKHIFDELAEKLANDYTVYCLDTRCHGESEKGKLSYDLMAEDVKQFINLLSIKDATLLGFSDGGIVALLLAIKYPALIKKYYVLGANVNPKGLSKKVRRMYKVAYFFFRDAKIGLMLKEPNITTAELNSITDKCVLIVGENDVIIDKHTKMIADNIKDSELIVLKGKNHSNYVIHTDFLYDIIKR